MEEYRCPICQSPLEGEWCRRCAKRRTTAICISLVTVGPFFGLGACGVAYATQGVPSVVSGILAAIALFGSPLVALGYLIAYFVQAGKKHD